MPPGSERRLEEELEELRGQVMKQQTLLEKRREASDSDTDYNMLMEAMEKNNVHLQEYSAQNADMVKKLLTMEAQLSEAQGVAKVCTDNASKLADVDLKVEESLKVAAGAAKMAVKGREEAKASNGRLQSELRAGLQGLAEELRGELAAGLEALAGRLRAEAEAAAEAARRQAEELARKQQEAERAAADDRERAAEELRAAREELRAELARAERAAAERTEEQGLRVRELVASLTSAQEEAGERLRELVRAQVQQLASSVQERLAAAQAESQRRLARLQEACAAAAGSVTQQVEWRIEDCLRQLGPVEPEGAARQWLSPPFEAAGVGGLRLELRARSRRGAGSGEGDVGALECSAFLHAPARLRLEFRLFIGNESLSLVHSFDDGGRCGAEHVGALSEHVSRQDGSLRLGVEILKAVREVVTVSPEREMPTGVLVSRQCINNSLPDTLDTRMKDMMESVSRRLDVSRSRAVRRVQWRVEQGSTLLQRFAQGKAVCSAPFKACGIDGLQMVFYPRGCEGAKQGFCSFFLVCPPGVTIRCWLWAGRWKREARLEPTGKQDLLGRVNFCRFQNCVDATSENVELALEIQEAEQSTLGGQQEMDSTFDAETLTPLQSSQAADLARVDVSSQKVQHALGKVLPDQVMQLPPVWTSHGFRSFEDAGADSLRCPTAQSEPRAGGGPPVPAPWPPLRAGAQGQARAASSPGRATAREPRRPAQTARGASPRTQPRGVHHTAASQGAAEQGKYREYMPQGAGPRHAAP